MPIVWNSETHLVDLCKDHDDLFIERGIRYLFKIGRAPEDQQRPPHKQRSRLRTAVPCLFAPWGCPATPKKLSLSSHVRGTHGVTLEDVRRDGPENVELPCPECGRMQGGVAGLGDHRRTEHGVAEAFARKLTPRSLAKVEREAGLAS